MATAAVTSPTSKEKGVHRCVHQLSIFFCDDLVKRARPGEYITSPTFRVAGCDWAILYHPAGEDMEEEKGRGRVRMRLRLLSHDAATEAKGSYTLSVNGGGDDEPPPERFDIHLLPGGPNFWGHSMESKHVPVKDDRVTVSFSLELFTSTEIGPSAAAAASSRVVTVPPPNMSEHLLHFLESKQGADVTFQVEHREFQAHKLLLAMRSPVFRAAFLGSMKEAATRSVRILDVKADVFETVLRFVYSDATPPDVQHLHDLDCNDKARVAAKVRDLLAAANRFGLERMRLMCEKALCEAMDSENAAAALRLADQHHCDKLKAFCIDYMASSPSVLKKVMATEAFQELKARCPSLLAHLLEKLATTNQPPLPFFQ